MATARFAVKLRCCNGLPSVRKAFHWLWSCALARLWPPLSSERLPKLDSRQLRCYTATCLLAPGQPL
eukprot:18048-Heterococcus_DN1.PRE.4